jgi:hypothetical protein
MKQSITKLLVSAAMLTTAVTPSAASAGSDGTVRLSQEMFKDLGQVSLNKKAAINQAVQLGFLEGDENGQYRPFDLLTRQELAVILTRGLKLPVDPSVSSSFEDVPSDLWGASFIAAVKIAGLMEGDGTTFRPNDGVTKQELAVILIRALHVNTSLNGDHKDLSNLSGIDDWAAPSILKALELGIMQESDLVFRSKQPMERQEIAQILVDTFQNKERYSVIDFVKAGTISIDGIEYTVSPKLSGLLQERNNDILKGAKVRFTTVNQQLSALSYLEIVQGGSEPAQGNAEFSANLVLDAEGVTLDGSVKVAADYVTVKNLNVTGEFEIARELFHDFYGFDVSISGKTTINGGDTNTVVFENSRLQTVDVNKQDVRVDTAGDTSVKEILVYSSTTLVGERGTDIRQVTLKDGARNVEIRGSIGSLVVDAKNNVTISGDAAIQKVTVNTDAPIQMNGTGPVKEVVIAEPKANINLDKAVKVGTLTLPEGAKAADVIKNFDTIKDQMPAAINGSTSVVPSSSPVGSSGDLSRDDEPSTDKSALNQKIHQALLVLGSKTVGTAKGNVPQSAYDALQGAIGTATGVQLNANATQTDVNGQVSALTTAVTAFNNSVIQVQVPLVDRSILISTILQAQSLLGSKATGNAEGNVTQAAFTDLQLAISAASNVNLDINASQADVNAQVTTLASAMTAFNNAVIHVDKMLLASSLMQAQSLLDNTPVGTAVGSVTQSVYDDLQTAYNTAKLVNMNANATQSEVNTQTVALNTAITTFQSAIIQSQAPTVDKSILNSTILQALSLLGSKAVGNAEGNVTQAAFTDLQLAISAASNVNLDVNASQNDVNAQAAALASAMSAFNNAVIHVDKAILSSLLSQAQALINTITVGLGAGDVPQLAHDSFQTAIAAADAVNSNANASQTEVDTQVSALAAAMTLFNQSVLQASNLTVGQLTLQTITGVGDRIDFTGLLPGDVVKVYNAPAGGRLLAGALSSIGPAGIAAFTFTEDLGPLGTDIWVTVTSAGKAESSRIAIQSQSETPIFLPLPEATDYLVVTAQQDYGDEYLAAGDTMKIHFNTKLTDASLAVIQSAVDAAFGSAHATVTTVDKESYTISVNQQILLDDAYYIKLSANSIKNLNNEGNAGEITFGPVTGPYWSFGSDTGVTMVFDQEILQVSDVALTITGMLSGEPYDFTNELEPSIRQNNTVTLRTKQSVDSMVLPELEPGVGDMIDTITLKYTVTYKDLTTYETVMSYYNGQWVWNPNVIRGTVSNITNTGFKIALEKAFPVLLEMTDVKFTNENRNPISVTSFTTSDNGMTYNVQVPINTGYGYYISSFKKGYSLFELVHKSGELTVPSETVAAGTPLTSATTTADGTLYLLQASLITNDNYLQMDNYVTQGKGTKATVAANSSTQLETIGLSSGTYKVYLVDKIHRVVSSPNLITISANGIPEGP